MTKPAFDGNAHIGGAKSTSPSSTNEKNENSHLEFLKQKLI